MKAKTWRGLTVRMFELLGGELAFNTRTHESKNVGGSMFKLGGSKMSPSIV